MGRAVVARLRGRWGAKHVALPPVLRSVTLPIGGGFHSSELWNGTIAASVKPPSPMKYGILLGFIGLLLALVWMYAVPVSVGLTILLMLSGVGIYFGWLRKR
jgi:hypothetical protein